MRQGAGIEISLFASRRLRYPLADGSIRTHHGLAIIWNRLFAVLSNFVHQPVEKAKVHDHFRKPPWKHNLNRVATGLSHF